MCVKFIQADCVLSITNSAKCNVLYKYIYILNSSLCEVYVEMDKF